MENATFAYSLGNHEIRKSLRKTLETIGNYGFLGKSGIQSCPREQYNRNATETFKNQCKTQLSYKVRACNISGQECGEIHFSRGSLIL